MPVRFRCDTCNGKLSIATRKIGTPVECPRCNESMMVPTASQIGEELTELLLTVGSRGREVAEETEDRSAPTPKPASRPGKSLNDMPLFERSDFDKLLDPRLKDAKPLPLPEPVPIAPAIDPFAHIDGIEIVQAEPSLLLLSLADASRRLPAIFSALESAGAEVRGTTLTQPSLESLFIKLTGKELRE